MGAKTYFVEPVIPRENGLVESSDGEIRDELPNGQIFDTLPEARPMDTKLTHRFDLIFDRGCFHGLHPGERPRYATAVGGSLRPAGCVLVKCFSEKEPDGWGPYRITPDVIQGVFADRYRIASVAETFYQGPFYHLRGRYPASYFVEVKRIEPAPTG